MTRKGGRGGWGGEEGPGPQGTGRAGKQAESPEPAVKEEQKSLEVCVSKEALG